MPIIGSLAGASSRALGGLRSFGSQEVSGNFVSLATAYVSSPQFGISFTDISQSFTHLQLRFRLSTNAEYSGRIYFNDDETHANYNYSWLQGNGTNVNFFIQNLFSYVNYDNTSGSFYSVGIIDIYDYKNVNKRKTVSSTMGWSNSSGQNTQNIVGALWKNTNAINKITIKPDSAQNFKVGSTIALYGIKTV